MKSQVARAVGPTRLGVSLWQEIRPQSRPSASTDTDIDAAVPMFRMYSTCTGDTERSIEKPRSMARREPRATEPAIWTATIAPTSSANSAYLSSRSRE